MLCGSINLVISKLQFGNTSDLLVVKTWRDTGFVFLWEVWIIKLKKIRSTRFKHRKIQKSYPTGGTWIAEMKISRI